MLEARVEWIMGWKFKWAGHGLSRLGEQNGPWLCWPLGGGGSWCRRERPPAAARMARERGRRRRRLASPHARSPVSSHPTCCTAAWLSTALWLTHSKQTHTCGWGGAVFGSPTMRALLSAPLKYSAVTIGSRGRWNPRLNLAGWYVRSSSAVLNLFAISLFSVFKWKLATPWVETWNSSGLVDDLSGLEGVQLNRFILVIPSATALLIHVQFSSKIVHMVTLFCILQFTFFVWWYNHVNLLSQGLSLFMVLVLPWNCFAILSLQATRLVIINVLSSPPLVVLGI